MQLLRFTPGDARRILFEFAELIDRWLTCRGAAAVPDWQDFDLPDLHDWQPFLMESEFQDEAPDPTIRLIGERVRDLLRHEIRDRRLSVLSPRLYDLQFRDHFRRIRAQGLVGLTGGQAPIRGRRQAFFRFLELPFRDGGGQAERVLHALARPPL